MAALYALARRIDDIGDGDDPPDVKVAKLDQVRPTCRPCDPTPGRVGGDPIFAALAHASTRFPIPLEAFDELIDGCEQDSSGTSTRPSTTSSHYCRLVAGTVGRLSLGVFGGHGHGRAVALADDLGVALQLTNILRDVKEDRGMGRVYLPADDLQEFGCTPDASGPRDAMGRLVRFECASGPGPGTTGPRAAAAPRPAQPGVHGGHGRHLPAAARAHRGRPHRRARPAPVAPDPGEGVGRRAGLAGSRRERVCGRGPDRRRPSSWSAAAWPGSPRRSSCADGGASVTLLERRPRLGGATWSFQRRGLWFDNGQHVFLRCCTAYLALPRAHRRRRASSHLQDRLDVPVMAPGGRTARLRRGHLPAPLHLGRQPRPLPPPVAAPTACALGRAALALRGIDLADPALDTTTFGDFLGRRGQTPGRHRAAVGPDLHADGQRAGRRRLAPAGRHGVPDRSAHRRRRRRHRLVAGAAQPAPRRAGAAAWPRVAGGCAPAHGVERIETIRPTATGAVRRCRRGEPLAADAVVVAVPHDAARRAPRRPRRRCRRVARSSGHHRSSTSTWCMTDG